MEQKAVVIGSGLGGLECAYILAKHGMQVVVLEQDTRIGGCLQTFHRRGVEFDTGFHYVGGLDQGQPLNRLFHYFDLMDLPWQRMDEDCFDEVVIGEQSFPFAQGHAHFAQRLADYFPHERANIDRYTRFLKSVGDHIFDSLSPKEASDFYSTSLFAQSAYQWLNETIQDPLLRQVLSGTSLKMELGENLPLYIFAQINNSFIQSAYRLRGGGMCIAERLKRNIEKMGGLVLTGQRASEIEVMNGQVTGVRTQNDFYPANWVISNAHPATTMSLLPAEAVRPVYRHRIERLANTYGMFTANIRLKPDCIPYRNKNLFIHNESTDLWHPDPKKTESVMVNYYLPDIQNPEAKRSTEYTMAIDLLSPMSWDEVKQWEDTRQGHRGEDYVALKQEKTEACLRIAEKHIPGLRDAIYDIYTSTPLSYQYYTSTAQGSAYGIRKDWQSPMTTVLTPRTPIAGLLLTGQNLNLHGILGVSMTALQTIIPILGPDSIDLRQRQG